MGESAAGKSTFIKYAIDNPECELIQRLGYNSGKIIPVIDNEASSYERIRIKDTVLDLLSKETNAVILIKWQAVDSILLQYGDTLKKLAAETPDIPREIILLSVDSDILYARVQKKSWWNKPNDPDSYYTQARQGERVTEIKNHANELSKLGFKIIEIDSTDGYRLM
jgi:hypothetical protein